MQSWSKATQSDPRANYKAMISNEKVSSNISISRNSSDNDYEYIGMKGKRNDNGQFYNMSMNVSFGYKINAVHFLKFYSQLFESERHFSGTIGGQRRWHPSGTKAR